MIKIKVQAEWDENLQKHKNFTVYLRFTDGIEPVLYTDNFDEVTEKIAELQKAIPQTTNYPIKINE